MGRTGRFSQGNGSPNSSKLQHRLGFEPMPARVQQDQKDWDGLYDSFYLFLRMPGLIQCFVMTSITSTWFCAQVSGHGFRAALVGEQGKAAGCLSLPPLSARIQQLVHGKL